MIATDKDWRPFEPSREAVEAVDDESRCGCTHEAGDSRCRVHPRCNYCGAITDIPREDCSECRDELYAAARRNGMPPSGRWA